MSGTIKKILMLITILLICIKILPLYGNEENNIPMPVFVSILPQAFFVEQIGGTHVSVEVLVKPGRDPHLYSPTPDQMVKLAKSKLYFRIGVPFEDVFMQKISTVAENVKIIKMQKGVRLRVMENPHENLHTHDTADIESQDTTETEKPGHNETEAGKYDPHIWLSPVLAKKLAENTYFALKSIDPVNEINYKANYESLIARLDDLDIRIRTALLHLKGGSVFVFHPSFGYFTDEYGLRQIAVEVEGKAPKGKDLSLFIKKAKKYNVKVIFVQPQFNRNAARAIANIINGVVVPIDPLAKDYIKNLEKIAELVGEALMSK